jgi:2-C-methyl-D-erythritol 4-phosphate cytidylyltransferase/2-C-methyl-D-erythritol 2,4-cyclodiphosphate synthase
MARCAALIAAAGQGARAQEGAVSAPAKQYRSLRGKSVLRWAAEAFRQGGRVQIIQVIIGPNDFSAYETAMAGLDLPPPIIGGTTRQESVRLGLEALKAHAPERVLIHDAARPFVSADLIARVDTALDRAQAAAPMLPVVDTLRRQTEHDYEMVSRDGLYRTQTPQGFHFDAILEAHHRFAHESVTDDFALAERAHLSTAVVCGEEINMKLTTPDDFSLAARIVAEAPGEMRVGSGFDVHAFGAGDHIWLCGIRIPHTAGLEGHSDADVGLHALTDAILGALAEADIGAHFPPSDERWRGAPSSQFLAHAAGLARARGATITHVDVTIIGEKPKLALYRDAMRQSIACILQIDSGRVSVKATTTDGLGFTGRGEGLAAQAIATLRFPS